MRIIDNERGGVLIYVLAISLLFMIVTPMIIFMTSNDVTRNTSDKHQLIATNLAVSGMESFIRYLDAYSTGDRLTYLNSYPGFTTTPKPFKTPEGVSVTYSLLKAGPTNNQYTITMTATAGSGRQVRSKKIIYTINSNYAPTVTTVITDDSSRSTLTGFYVQGSSSGNGLPTPLTDTSLKTAIGSAITYYKKSVTDRNAIYSNNAVVCPCANADQIMVAINNSSANPVILKMSQDTISIDSTVSFGTAAKPVVLIFNNLSTNNANITVTGDLIVQGNLTSQNNATFIFNEATQVNEVYKTKYGSLSVMGTFSSSNINPLTVPQMLFIGKFTPQNNSVINAGKMIIETSYEIKTDTTLNIGSDLIAGSISVQNNAVINATAGDILVKDDFTSSTNIKLKAGGSIAAGGNFTANNNSTITTGGATSSLVIPVTTPGGGSSGSAIGWSPSRQ